VRKKRNASKCSPSEKFQGRVVSPQTTQASGANAPSGMPRKKWSSPLHLGSLTNRALASRRRTPKLIGHTFRICQNDSVTGASSSSPCSRYKALSAPFNAVLESQPMCSCRNAASESLPPHICPCVLQRFPLETTQPTTLMSPHVDHKNPERIPLEACIETLRGRLEAVSRIQGGHTHYQEELRIFNEVANEQGWFLPSAPSELSLRLRTKATNTKFGFVKRTEHFSKRHGRAFSACVWSIAQTKNQRPRPLTIWSDGCFTTHSSPIRSVSSALCQPQVATD